MADVRQPAKYLVGIQEDEMVCRLLYSFVGEVRPDLSAQEALKPFDEEAIRNARRAVRSIMDYWRESIKNLQPTN